VVAAGGQRDVQGAQQAGVVVDDEHAGHDGDRASAAAGTGTEGSATGRETTSVRPPPGVSSAVSVPPMASVNPRPTLSPSPRPAWSRSPRCWKATKSRSAAP